MKYIKKDITTVDYGMIAHGCNCSGGFGSGVAGAIRKKWPKVYETFKRMPTGKTMLGTACLVNIDYTDRLFVANCYTQVFYGKGGRFADPEAIRKSLTQVYKWADYYGLPIYMPKIGAGLGGLDWDKEVEPIVKQIDEDFERIDTYICDLEEVMNG